MDPELAIVVERARRRAEAGGELHPHRAAAYELALPPDARSILREWLDDGGYDEAVALVVADDPELSIQ
jgi:hypothetical protein